MSTGLVGTFEYKVDGKGRVPLPPRWREELRGGFFLTVVAEKCITGYSEAEWGRVVADLGSDPMPDERTRRIKRQLMADAYRVEMDAQGRVVLLPVVREHAGITDSAVVVGAGNYFEVWNPEQWRAEKAIVREHVKEDIESLRAQRRQ